MWTPSETTLWLGLKPQTITRPRCGNAQFPVTWSKKQNWKLSMIPWMSYNVQSTDDFFDVPKIAELRGKRAPYIGTWSIIWPIIDICKQYHAQSMGNIKLKIFNYILRPKPPKMQCIIGHISCCNSGWNVQILPSIGFIPRRIESILIKAPNKIWRPNSEFCQYMDPFRWEKGRGHDNGL